MIDYNVKAGVLEVFMLQIVFFRYYSTTLFPQLPKWPDHESEKAHVSIDTELLFNNSYFCFIIENDILTPEARKVDIRHVKLKFRVCWQKV